MFGIVNAIPTPLKLGSPHLKKNYIASVCNQIKQSNITCWIRNHPHAPQTCSIDAGEILQTKINIPLIESTSDLLGTHLEIQVLNPEKTQCFIRALLWTTSTENTIFMNTPNDTNRDIDHMAEDLTSTQRIFHETGPFHIILKKHLKHYYIQINQMCIAMEYLYD
jgi:hypothetical protein